MVNRYADCSIGCQYIVDEVAKSLVENDIDDSHCISVYSPTFSSMLFQILTSCMSDFNIPFMKKSKHFSQTAYAKIDVPDPMHDIKLYCEIVGVSSNNIIEMTSAYVMQLRIDGHYIRNPRYAVY